MNILIVGNGGREHALAWKLLQSPRVQRIRVAPGNAGTAGHNVDIAASDIPALLAFARENEIDLTVVGPEAPLAAGIVDTFIGAGLRVFGPRRAAAQLEASKLFSKSIMRASGVPTANFAVFDAFDQALRFARALPFASAPACVSPSLRSTVPFGFSSAFNPVAIPVFTLSSSSPPQGTFNAFSIALSFQL